MKAKCDVCRTPIKIGDKVYTDMRTVCIYCSPICLLNGSQYMKPYLRIGALTEEQYDEWKEAGRDEA